MSLPAHTNDRALAQPLTGALANMPAPMSATTHLCVYVVAEILLV
jgi:hypothetical protein